MRVEHEQGYTLIEMLLVVGLLAIIAAIAVPSFSDNNDVALDRTAREIVRAIRFAHIESVRTGQKHGAIFDASAQSLKVYRLDESANPAVAVYDVYDPLSKQLYDLRFDTAPLKAGITQIYFKFADVTSPLTSVGFAGDSGIPGYNEPGSVRMLESGYVDISLNGANRRISVSPMTGRVTVQ